MQRSSSINRLFIEDGIFDSMEFYSEISNKTGISNLLPFSDDSIVLQGRDILISNHPRSNDCLVISSNTDSEVDFVYQNTEELLEILGLISRIDYPLLRYLTGLTVEKIYKIASVEERDSLIEFMEIEFSNRIAVRCIPFEIFNHRCFIKRRHYENNSNVLVARSELLDADISKTRYDLSLFNTTGDTIYHRIETVSPSKIYKE